MDLFFSDVSLWVFGMSQGPLISALNSSALWASRFKQAWSTTVIYSLQGGCLGATAKLGPCASRDTWASVREVLDKLLTHLLEYMVVVAVIVISVPADVVVVVAVADVIAVAVVVIAGVLTVAVVSGTVMTHVFLWSTFEQPPRMFEQPPLVFCHNCSYFT